DHDTAPEVLGFDAKEHVLVLQWLAPDTHPGWKAQLMGGHVDVATASLLGARLGALHREGTALFADARRRPVWDAAAPLFETLRIQPHLVTTAERVPEVAGALLAIAASLRATRTTIIHGDVNPKNVLVGPNGPMIIGAECACSGDPAFDVAFLLNHMLLKSVHLPASAASLRSAAEAFWA
ncbi:unnamed protein product, partial [Phaeothamnion confervicola]